MRLAFALVLLAAVPARAEEPSACSAFAWPLSEVRAALTVALPAASTGTQAPGTFELALAPFDGVKFPTAPARKPKKVGTFGGYVTIVAPAARLLQVSLSDEAWIDAVQDGHDLKTAAFSGKPGCTGLRKSVRFEGTAAGPLTLQISGAETDHIRVDVRGAE